MKYDPKVVTDCVRETFSTPSGQVTLSWLRDLYVNYRSQALVQSPNPNLGTQLGYRLGQQDVIIMIDQILDGGLSSLDEQESSSMEEESYE